MCDSEKAEPGPRSRQRWLWVVLCVLVMKRQQLPRLCTPLLQLFWPPSSIQNWHDTPPGPSAKRKYWFWKLLQSWIDKTKSIIVVTHCFLFTRLSAVITFWNYGFPVYICKALSSLAWSLSSRRPQAPQNHCYLSNTKTPFTPLPGSVFPAPAVSFIHTTSLLRQHPSKFQAWSWAALHVPLLGRITCLTISCSSLQRQLRLDSQTSSPSLSPGIFVPWQRDSKVHSERLV